MFYTARCHKYDAGTAHYTLYIQTLPRPPAALPLPQSLLLLQMFGPTGIRQKKGSMDY